jgi:hypothetical protein
MGTESFCTGRSRGGRNRNSLSPTGGLVHEGENVGVSLGRWKRTNKVDVDMGKTAGRNGNGNVRRLIVEMHLCFLTRNALPGPLVNIPGHGMPKET